MRSVVGICELFDISAEAGNQLCRHARTSVIVVLDQPSLGPANLSGLARKFVGGCSRCESVVFDVTVALVDALE